MEGLKKTLNASQDNSLHYRIDVKEKNTFSEQKDRCIYLCKGQVFAWSAHFLCNIKANGADTGVRKGLVLQGLAKLKHSPF